MQNDFFFSCLAARTQNPEFIQSVPRIPSSPLCTPAHAAIRQPLAAAEKQLPGTAKKEGVGAVPTVQRCWDESFPPQGGPPGLSHFPQLPSSEGFQVTRRTQVEGHTTCVPNDKPPRAPCGLRPTHTVLPSPKQVLGQLCPWDRRHPLQSPPSPPSGHPRLGPALAHCPGASLSLQSVLPQKITLNRNVSLIRAIPSYACPDPALQERITASTPTVSWAPHQEAILLGLCDIGLSSHGRWPLPEGHAQKSAKNLDASDSSLLKAKLDSSGRNSVCPLLRRAWPEEMDSQPGVCSG